MRRLATSGFVAWVVIAMYLCASLAAVPVPRFAGGAADRPSGCACSAGSGCCQGGSCCCGVVHDGTAADERGGPELLVLGCESKVKWYLACVPAVAGGAGDVVDMEQVACVPFLAGDLVSGSRVLDVPSPPPRLALA